MSEGQLNVRVYGSIFIYHLYSRGYLIRIGGGGPSFANSNSSNICQVDSKDKMGGGTNLGRPLIFLESLIINWKLIQLTDFL